MRKKLLIISAVILALLCAYELFFMKHYGLSKGLLYMPGLACIIGLAAGAFGIALCKAVAMLFLYRKTDYYKKDQEWSHMIALEHPFIVFAVAAFIIPWTKGKVRSAVEIMVPTIAFLFLFDLSNKAEEVNASVFWGLQLYHVDKLSLLFAFVFVIYTFLAHIYGFNNQSKLSSVSANLYIGSSIGAVLAGDLITLFVFWEIMALSSCLLIWNPGRPSASAALFRYLSIHMLGGLLFFAGLMMKAQEGEFLMMHLDNTPGTWLIFIGFSVNAAIPPLHAWLPDAYPKARPAASVYMCALTTKVAVYAFARCFDGYEILIYLGAFAAVYGVVFALMENDIRRLLSYHIICQVGYMLCGIGIGTGMAVSAGVGHAIGNILFKGLLFMATGAIIYMTGKSKLSELGGMFRHSKAILIFYCIGALAISGFPGLNGFITKGLLVDAAKHEHLYWLALTLKIVSAGTFLSIGLKLAYFAFFAPETDALKATNIKPLPTNMFLGMVGLSTVCFLFGIYPKLFFAFLPHEIHENPFTAPHIVQTLQLLFATFVGFLLIVKKLHTKDVLTLDVDWIYRKGAPLFIDYVCRPTRSGQDKTESFFRKYIKSVRAWTKLKRSDQRMPPISKAIVWIGLGAVIVIIYLFLR